jgi:hypothetical protein
MFQAPGCFPRAVRKSRSAQHATLRLTCRCRRQQLMELRVPGPVAQIGSVVLDAGSVPLGFNLSQSATPGSRSGWRRHSGVRSTCFAISMSKRFRKQPQTMASGSRSPFGGSLAIALSWNQLTRKTEEPRQEPVSTAGRGKKPPISGDSSGYSTTLYLVPLRTG